MSYTYHHMWMYIILYVGCNYICLSTCICTYWHTGNITFLFLVDYPHTSAEVDSPEAHTNAFIHLNEQNQNSSRWKCCVIRLVIFNKMKNQSQTLIVLIMLYQLQAHVGNTFYLVYVCEHGHEHTYTHKNTYSTAQRIPTTSYILNASAYFPPVFQSTGKYQAARNDQVQYYEMLRPDSSDIVSNVVLLAKCHCTRVDFTTHSMEPVSSMTC